MTVYIGLLRPDGTEPDAASGYKRVCIGEADLRDPSEILRTRQIVFPDTETPGYGVISHVAVYCGETDSPAVVSYRLPEAMDVHQDVTPVIYQGRLYRGVAVQAKAVMQSRDRCRAGGLGA